MQKKDNSYVAARLLDHVDSWIEYGDEAPAHYKAATRMLRLMKKQGKKFLKKT